MLTGMWIMAGCAIVGLVASDPSAFFVMEQRNAPQSLEGFVREKKKDSLATELASER